MTQSHAGASVSVPPTLAEQPTPKQYQELFAQVDRRRVTRQSLQAFLRGGLVLGEMKREEWIAREVASLKIFKGLGLSVVPDSDRVAVAWKKGDGAHDRYLPKGLTMPALLDACGAAGIKLSSGHSVPSSGEALPTEEGVLTVDFIKIMVPINRHGHPFMLNFDQQVECARGESGDGLTSVEETLYTLLRSWLELDRMLFMGGWIRCRNGCGSDRSLGVYWGAVDGLGVNAGRRAGTDWSWGALPRQFRPIG